MRTQPEGGICSRRQMLSTGAALATMSPLAFAQGGLPLPAEPSRDITSVDAGRDRNNLLTIEVMINGKGPFRFVVDTGADRSVLADSTAAAIGLIPSGLVMVEGVVRTVQAGAVHVDHIAFGAVERENLVLPLLPRAWLGADGFLGLDMLADSLVTLDFREKKLMVERAQRFWQINYSRIAENKVQAEGANGHLRALNCRVDGVRTSVFLDTGAEISVANPALFDALCADNLGYALTARTIQIAGVTGGALDGRVAPFRQIRIHGMLFTDGTFAVADMQIFHLWGLEEKPALLIGMNFLRQFSKVSVDFGRKEFRFEVSQADIFLAGSNRAAG